MNQEERLTTVKCTAMAQLFLSKIEEDDISDMPHELRTMLKMAVTDTCESAHRILKLLEGFDVD